MFKRRKRKRQVKVVVKQCKLYDADPNCDHKIVALWSGVKCSKCGGWFCI